MKKLLLKFLPIADIVLAPFVYPAAWILKQVRHAGVQRLPLCRKVLMKVGVFPIRNHYYEPQFDNNESKQAFSVDRSLPGIDWNEGGQLELLGKFNFASELKNLPEEKPEGLEYYLNNGEFASGDAEYWYQLIRSIKPRKVFEVGSGNSTLMAIKAIAKNREEDPYYKCRHLCIEPYEMPWLEKTGVEVVREKIEDVSPALFAELEENDLLFIDSSHMIRPQGDVLFEYLELLPSLKTGVIVHVHDIFSPRNYPRQWLQVEVRFWNEQYLLEAFLSHNDSWKILGALNFLHHKHFAKLKAIAPYLTPEREPGSFYLQKIG